MKVASGLATPTNGRTAVGGGARQEFLRLACPHHVNGPVAHGLCKHPVEEHQLRMELPRIAIERREQGRARQIEIGLIERDLGGVDWSRQNHATLDDLFPRRGADRLVLPQRREGHRRRAAEKTPVDMAFEAAVEGREAELPAVGVPGSEIESGGPQPARHHLLAAMARFEDPESARVEIPVRVLRHGEIVVLDLTEALTPEARAADIVPWRLCSVTR